MNKMLLSLPTAVSAALILAVVPARGQVPTFQEVTGHQFGERATQHFQMVDYLERLADASPRVEVWVQGRSWEHREFLLAVITSPANHARLEGIQENSRRLADGRITLPEEAWEIIQEQPVIVWLGGSIHGFELSGAEGALKLLEHLSTRDDPATLEVLDNVVVLIDPMLNPDGREAFVHINHENLGTVPQTDPRDWSNSFTGWQGTKYRTGHYYFDTNRDWFAHTQQETRERLPWLHAWRPQVAVDMHEMGAGTEFYFDPPGQPYNPNFPHFARTWFERFGHAYAEAFDSAGFEYMTGERYNYFYPGYTSNRGYQGAVAMLFEQGSSRGLALERPDGTVRTLADALEQQYVGAFTAARLAATNRVELLTDYYESQRGILTVESDVPVRYLIANEGDPVLVRELVDLLRRNDAEISVLESDVQLSDVLDREGNAIGRRSFPAGTFVVDARQPAGRLIRTLLDPKTPLPPDFLAEARARVLRAENPRFYDITAWSLPLLFNVGGYSSRDGRDLPARPLRFDEPTTPVTAAVLASYAYVLDGRSAHSLAAMYHLRKNGYRTAVITRATRVGGRDIPGGSVIVRVGQNDSTVHTAVVRVAEHFGVQVWALDTGLGEAGFPALGSGDYTFNVKPVDIALLGEDPIQGYSFGWAWYTLDYQHGIPITILRTQSVSDTDLSHYEVLVIPETSAGPLAQVLGEVGTDRIIRWVRDGGTLVTIGSATDFARIQLDLIDLRSWYDTDEADGAQHFSVPGAVFRVNFDSGYWLAAGYDSGEVPVLVDSDRLYLAPDAPPSGRHRVVATYVDLISGHAWEETLVRIPGTVAVYEERVGSGRVIAFAEDPNYRGYHRGLNRLFLNAVVLGPSAP